MIQREGTQAGKLWIVPTPIGNLEDITFRALKVLRSCDTILCEDTRTSSVLLKHYDIEKPLKKYHMHNEHKVLENLVSAVQQGSQLALITDAGTPGIADPGFLLVRACIKENLKVECLPGAVALIPALVCSGFPSDRFVFEGFLPPKKGRVTRLASLAKEPRTVVLYESPHKLMKTLEALKVSCGADRMLSVSREISKLFETHISGTIAEVITYFESNPPKGEFVLVLHGAA
jgi:16S rRNA (cytidine1402-2'-O)-methyltransferase